jgi:hypothetical protein
MLNSKLDTWSSVAKRMDIWRFTRDVSDRLLLWNAANIAVGLMLGRRGGFMRGFGSQNVAWGIVNAAIAFIGRRVSEKRMRALDDPFALEEQRMQIRNLRLLLAVNGVLDVTYMIAGKRVASRGRILSARRGIGLGIMLQGLLLFLFDWRMYRRSFQIAPTRSEKP